MRDWLKVDKDSRNNLRNVERLENDVVFSNDSLRSARAASHHHLKVRDESKTHERGICS